MPLPSAPRGRRAAVAAGLTAALVVLGWWVSRPPDGVCGDGWEYWYQAESFRRHGTPDLWDADVAAVNDEAAALDFPAPPPNPYAYSAAPDGRRYGMHFWAYGLTACPAKAILRAVNGCELAALAVANGVLFAVALGVVLFGSSAPPRERLALAGLAAVGPVLWYLRWQGAEVFSWAFALMAVVAYRDDRHGWAGLAAGLAATQNPPLLFLGGTAVLAAAAAGRWRMAAAAAAGTAVGLAPFAFFQLHFGAPSLIVGTAEYAGPGNLSACRTWGLLTDFNHGLLAYVPVLVVGVLAGAVRLMFRPTRHGLLLLAGCVTVAVSTQVAHNWNSACDGLQRYLLWMLPLAAGVTVEGLSGWRGLGRFATAAAAVHIGILLAYGLTGGTRDGYLSHTPVAAWVLSHAPRAYWIEPETFIERTDHRDGWPFFPADLPVGFTRDDGAVTKLLFDAASLDGIDRHYHVELDYLERLRRQASGRPGLHYAHPPDGSVWRRLHVDP